MSLLDEYKQLQKNSGTQQNSGNERKSLLQEYVDQNGTAGLNEKYVNTSLQNGGGFGATAAGTYSSSLVDENYISAFFSEANKYLGKAKEDYEGMGYSNASTIFGSNSSALRDLKKRYGAISQYLQQNENSIDKDAYSYFSSTLSSYRDAFDEYQNAFKNANDFYSQWKTEDDYNDYVARQKDYQEKLSYDTVSAQKELDDLNAQFEEAKRLRNERDLYISGAARDPAKATSAQTRLDSLLKRYGYSDIEEMEKDISGKNQYLTLSKRIQDAEKLRSDALGDSDFKEFSEMGASIENPSFEDAENAFVIFGKTYGGADIGNKVTYSRENAVELAMGEGNGTTMKGRSIYRYMTDEEVSIYNYYLAKEGEEKADEYLDSIAEELNYREATGIYDRALEGNTAIEVVFGAMAGLDQAASGFRSLFSNSDDYVPASSTQIAGQMAREDLADAGPNLPEWAGGASLGQLAYDFTSTSANMAPSFLVSALTGSPLLGSITLGASAAGNAYQEKINLGYSKEQARAYAGLIGASEMGLQYLLGGIGKLGGKVSNNFVNTLISNVDNAFARTALKLGGNMASEFTEEYLQDVLTPWFENLTLYTENDVKLYTPDYLYSGLMGALTAGFMEGPSTVAGEVQTYKTGKTIQKSDFSVERLAKLGQSFSADSVAYRLAGKVNENTGAYTIGRLFNEIGATLTEQNQSEIIKSLERKGVAHDDAVTISETLAAVVDGASITEMQAAALEANDVVSKTIMDVIVNPNSTVNQRTQNYNEALMALAQEKAKGRKGASKAAAEPQELAGSEMAPAEGKSTTDTKVTPERMLEASVDGKTINNKTGEEVKIESIASIQNGEMMLKLDSGETVNARDVSYASEGDALIYETVARMDTNAAAANQLVQAYEPSIPAEVYARGIEEAYRYGMYNIPVSEMMDKGSFSADLTAVQRYTAYRLGQIFGNDSVSKRQDTIQKNRKSGQAVENGKVHFNGDRNALNARQSASLSAMEKIADALGIQIYVFESEEVDGKRQGANGWFDPKDSSIHIDLYAGQNGEATMLFTAAHELTHFIRKWSPAKFKVLANFLMEQYGKKNVSVDTLVQNQIAKAKKNGRDISYDTAYEEVIADSMETMLSDGKVAEKLALLKAKDKTLWGKIKEFFSDLMAKIQEVYKGMKPNSVEGQYVAEMKDALERLQELFTEGLVDAGENYQGAQGSTAPDVGEVRFSIKNTSKMTIDEQLRLFRKGDLKSSDSFYFGETPNIYGESFSGNPLVMNQSDFKKAHTKKHNVPNRIFKRLTELLSRPIMSFTQDGRTAVVLDDIDGDGKPLVATLHASEQMDRETVTAVTSVYGIDHWEQWISNQSKKQITIHDKKRANAVLQTYGSNASVEDAIRSMGTSVSQEVDTVNNKFSLRNNVEETKDLVAVHNLTESKLAKTLSLGGLPMPSIAIVRARDGHSEFGDISLVFRKETIDPEFSRRNKVYSGDAWTPTYPRVEYKPNEKVLKKIKDKITGMVPYEVQNELGSLHFDSDNVSNNLDRYDGSMVEAYKQNDSMKYAYLKDIGTDIDLPVKEADLYRYGEVSNAAVRYFSGKLADGLRTVELYQNMSVNDMLQDKDLTGAVADTLNYDVLRTLKPGSAEYLEYEKNPVFHADKVSFREIDGLLIAARKLFQNGIQKTVDGNAAKKLIRDAVEQNSYEKWLKDLFNGVVEKEGIRNEKDFFTPSGNRRSFEALHYENNLENVVKAMREQGEKGIGVFGGGNIFGASTTEFSSVDQIKQSEDRLQKMSDEEYQKIKDGFSERFFELASSLPKNQNSFTATDDAANMLIEAVVKYKTKSGMASYLRKESQGWANYSDYVVDDLMELVQEIRNMPTGYFEAKPQRAVGFDEIAAVIVPDDLSDGIRTQLNSMGLNVLSYENGNNESRKEALNSLEDVKFSDRDSEGSELSKEQQEFFKDSQVRDENGNLLVVYHGTRKADFTVFNRNYNFYTDNPEMADSYAPKGEKFIGYLNITNPYIIDAGGEKWSGIPVDGELKTILDRYGSSTFRENGKWRTTPADIASAIEEGIDEGEFDYDGIIIRNVDDAGSYYKKNSSVVGNDYISFNSNQFKNRDNRKPTSDRDIRYSLREVEPVQPSSDKWKRTLTTEEAKSRFPSLWDVAAEESEVRNPTQISSTVKSYRKIYDFLKSEGFDGTILDASSGLGYGTRAGIEEYGFDVEDIEPYPDKNYNPKYKDYSALNKKYDVIISNAVLNVLPQDQRDALAVKMGELLNDGGRIFINVRGKDVDTLASTKTNVNISPMEWFVGSTGSYQKGFTKSELVAYLQDALGEGFTVNPTNMFGAVSVVVTKESSVTDVKFQDRSNDFEKVNQVLERENAKLREDVSYLKELLKLQKTVTGGTKFTRSSVEAAAGQLMKYAGARGDKAELVKRLNTFYEYIAKGEELTWESVKDAASPVSEWLMDNVVTQHKLDDYAVEVLRDIRGMRVYLNEVQKQEVAYKYGSFNEFRRKAMGSIIITDKDSISLDSKWVELSAKYPDLFDANTSDANQPIELMDAFDRLRSMDVGGMEYAYEADMIEQDLMRQVYDSYWNVSTLRTVADVKQKQINALKFHHMNRMRELQESHKENTEKLKREYQEKINRLRNEYRDTVISKQEKMKAKYRESRERSVEGRKKTVIRNKIKDVVNELNTYLLKGTKEKHVMIGLQKAVAEALDVVNMDTVGAEQRLAKLNEELVRAKTPEKIKEIMVKIQRVEAMGDKMSDRLNKLKTAYAEIKDSNDPLIANSHDEVIEAAIESVANSVGDTALRDMSLSQLEDVYDLYKMVLTRIRDANKTFSNNKKESIDRLASNTQMEVENVGGKKKFGLKSFGAVNSFLWNNFKPVYAFKAIGSKTLSGLFDNVRAGEDTWARDVSEARAFYMGQSKKYGYDTWDMEKTYRFRSTSGMDFKLNLEQMMSLYAYSKRSQAEDHLKYGGIVLENSFERKNLFGKFSIKLKTEDATAYNISPETLSEIIGKLTSEQKAFVDQMQDYLSTTMGAKGNEVSLEMYGVKLFKEKFYFPLKSAQQYMAKAREQANGEVKIKNSGFTKDTNPHAKNPIVLEGFMDVWANHVNDMSMYHAFTLPLEDFYRVYNYRTPSNNENMPTEGVNPAIENAYGKAATRYIEQLLKDLNGGARSDPTAGFINKMMGLFKKGAVFASASVVIQQPSAIARALALVDSKYFAGKKMDNKKHAALWEEVKQYAPVAIIKEMGYFDTNMGKSTVDFIKANEYDSWGDKMTALVKDSGYRDEVLFKAPALADELAWCQIWEAVKRETVDKTSLKPGSEEFLNKAGERFTEVIVNTQVYDSVLSRSANMRSKDTGMKMATAFLAEPTTSINMIADALIQGKRGNRKYARSAIGAVVASQILNAILVSFVYAGRDDDEDETYWEKYIGSLTAEIKDSFNLFSYIPFVKDIVSIVQGYDVERSDISVISDLWKAWEQLSSDKLSTYRKVENFAGSIAQLFGLPVRNIMRDARGLYQTVNSFMNGQKTTGAGVKYAVIGAITNQTVSDGKQLYEAMLNDDAAHAARVRSRFKDQSAVDSAIRKALRENDPRIHEAAVARANGDMAEYTRIAKEIIAEGHFSQDYVVSAISTEMNQLNKDDSTSTASSKVSGLYNSDDFASAVINGDSAMANAIKTDIIQTAQKNGKTAEEAEKSFISSASSACRELYEAGDLTEYQAVSALETYCGKTAEEATSKVQYWDFKQSYPEYDLSEEAVNKYYTDLEHTGISMDAYCDYYVQRSECKGVDADNDGKTDSGSVKAEVMIVIDSLPITSEQKDALYFLNGWAASKLSEAPWH